MFQNQLLSPSILQKNKIRKNRMHRNTQIEYNCISNKPYLQIMYFCKVLLNYIKDTHTHAYTRIHAHNI